MPDISQEANGVAPVVEALSQKSALSGDQVAVITIGVKKTFDGVTYFCGGRWEALGRLDFSPKLIWRCLHSLTIGGIFHNHGLWSSLNIALGFMPKSRNTKIVVSPHGTLGEAALKNRSTKKRLFWPLQKILLKRADLIHVTSLDEFNDVRRLGFKNPVAIIGNGVELVDYSICNQGGYKSRRRLLFLGRLHPQKGLDNLIKAWRDVNGSYPDWDLVIAGPGDAEYVRHLKDLVLRLGSECIYFAGPVYGAAKFNMIGGADIFILPSYGENFGMAVAEALMTGCPVIVSKAAPWSEVVKHGCGWWVDNDVNSISRTLDMAMSMTPDDLKQMGASGRTWMESDFSWVEISEKFRKSYDWIQNGGEKPDWIKL